MIASHTVARFQANQADVDKSIKITVEVNLMSKMYELYKNLRCGRLPFAHRSTGLLRTRWNILSGSPISYEPFFDSQSDVGILEL